MVILVVIAVCPGCVVPVVVPKADTVLAIHREAKEAETPVRMGLQWTYFGEDKDQYVIHARGAFPREHETWVFWYPLFTTAHPHPDFNREIRITWSKSGMSNNQASCRIQMLLEKWPEPPGEQFFEAYTGEIDLSFRFDRKRVSTNLPKVILNRVGSANHALHVSGEIVAERLDTPHLATEDFSKRWSEAVQR